MGALQTKTSVEILEFDIQENEKTTISLGNKTSKK